MASGRREGKGLAMTDKQMGGEYRDAILRCVRKEACQASFVFLKLGAARAGIRHGYW
jgi:hypothetical protein